MSQNGVNVPTSVGDLYMSKSGRWRWKGPNKMFRIYVAGAGRFLSTLTTTAVKGQRYG
jgi:hypothetical protein